MVNLWAKRKREFLEKRKELSEGGMFVSWVVNGVEKWNTSNVKDVRGFPEDILGRLKELLVNKPEDRKIQEENRETVLFDLVGLLFHERGMKYKFVKLIGRKYEGDNIPDTFSQINEIINNYGREPEYFLWKNKTKMRLGQEKREDSLQIFVPYNIIKPLVSRAAKANNKYKEESRRYGGFVFFINQAS